MPILELIRGRHSFFSEGAAIGRNFVVSIRFAIEDIEENRRENKENLKRGIIYFFFTCILDYVVCTM
jgi:hypothetical protein